MIDWYDRNQCHHTNPAAHERTNGRIFRVFYNNAKPVKVDLAKLSDAELVKLQLHANDWYVRHSRRLLQERAGAGKLETKVHAELCEIALDHANETRRLRALWALHVTGGVTETLARRLLDSPHPYVRASTIQLASAKPQATKRLAEMARKDPSPVVRLY